MIATSTPQKISSQLMKIFEIENAPSPVGSVSASERRIQVLVIDDSLVQRKMCRMQLAGKVLFTSSFVSFRY